MAFPLSPHVLVAATVAAGPFAPAEARALVREALDGRLEDKPVLDAVLVTSEMVVHRIVHGALRDGEPIDITVRIGAFLVISVDDPAPPVPAASVMAGNFHDPPLLRLLQGLCRRWGAGAQSRPRLWAELAA